MTNITGIEFDALNILGAEWGLSEEGVPFLTVTILLLNTKKGATVGPVKVNLASKEVQERTEKYMKFCREKIIESLGGATEDEEKETTKLDEVNFLGKNDPGRKWVATDVKEV